MKIILMDMESDIYAMNPLYLAAANQLKLETKGATHVMLVSAPIGTKLDVQKAEVRKLFDLMNDDILQGRLMPVENTGILAACISHAAMMEHNNNIPVSGIAAEYSLFACRYDKIADELTVYLPTHSQIRYRVDVTVEVGYEVVPYQIRKKKGFGPFGREEIQATPFHQLTVGTKDRPFPDGSIVYTIGEEPCEYPLTEAMSGRPLLIRTDGQKLRLQSVSGGISLKMIQNKGR